LPNARPGGTTETVVGLPPLIPRGIEALGCEVSYEMDAINAADVVYVLRMQGERVLAGANYVLKPGESAKTARSITKAQKRAIRRDLGGI